MSRTRTLKLQSQPQKLITQTLFGDRSELSDKLLHEHARGISMISSGIGNGS